MQSIISHLSQDRTTFKGDSVFRIESKVEVTGNMTRASTSKNVRQYQARIVSPTDIALGSDVANFNNNTKCQLAKP
eukprot:2669594-Amphidinium_carterae.1